MAVKVFSITLGAASAKLSTSDLAFRQLVLSATGADAVIGDGTLVATNGIKVAVAATAPVILGPFESGPLKLSDLWGVGAGATLQVLGIGF